MIAQNGDFARLVCAVCFASGKDTTAITIVRGTATCQAHVADCLSEPWTPQAEILAAVHEVLQRQSRISRPVPRPT